MSRLRRISQWVRDLNPVAVAVELLIVFVGVYLAFVLNEYQEAERNREKRETVIELLREGLEQYGRLFEGYAQFHTAEGDRLRLMLAEGELPDLGGAFYVAPQYPIDVINHVLTNESLEVFDTELYIPLTEYAARMQRIMSVEAQITEIGNRYIAVTRSDPRYQEQRHLAGRYLLFMESRGRIAGELAERSRRLNEMLQ